MRAISRARRPGHEPARRARVFPFFTRKPVSGYYYYSRDVNAGAGAGPAPCGARPRPGGTWLRPEKEKPLIYRARYVVTMDGPPIAEGCLRIKGDRVVKAGTLEALGPL